jgi:hypothetical protein
MTFHFWLSPGGRKRAFVRISWADQFKIHKIHPGGRRSHPAARSQSYHPSTSVLNLWQARQTSVAGSLCLAISRATKLGSKSRWSMYIELIQTPRLFWLLNCHTLLRPADRLAVNRYRQIIGANYDYRGAGTFRRGKQLRNELYTALDGVSHSAFRHRRF